jgi:purine-binding chemotaxis protein CheW
MGESVLHDQFVVVEMGSEKYGLNISEIHEIIKMQKITEVPNGRPYMVGVTNLRGKIVPIISLRKRFRFAEAAWTRSTRIIVVNCGDEIVGIIVDAIREVTRFSEIQTSTEIVSGAEESYFNGVGYSGNELVSILHIHHVLNG